jgi:hypothetical protein
MNTTQAPKSLNHLVRGLICGVTVAATVPYLTLKIIWISGGTAGVIDRSFIHGQDLLGLNVATFGMELVAALIAIALARDWGRHRPAWLVLLPMWIGTGLLAPIAIAVPVMSVLGTVTSTSLSGSESLRPWVYEMVYGGFAVQGAGLAAAFVFYARSRWGDVLATPTAAVRAPRGRGSATGAAVNLAVILLVLVGSAHLYWSFGGTAGLTATERAGLGTSEYVAEGIFVLTAVAATAGVTMLVHGLGRLRLPLTLVWIGAGALFTWGVWGVLNSALSTVLADDTPLANAISVAQVLAGALVAAVVVVHLAGRRTEVVRRVHPTVAGQGCRPSR